ncbi:metallophosphoesterase [Ileibacterium valens]|uniref:metallophosphoesterase n=1 Tax=Ileibacterium valens TaxID=1862668 RepID=UPI0024BB8450|nr:metallophosphoesterase [Ileibacterium valens]
MNRKVKSIWLDSFEGREIVISDIHGDYDGYNLLLKKINYQPGQDRLILLGDLVEKGFENLKLLRQIKKQTEEENVYAVMGNCDFVAKNFLYSYRLDFIKEVLLKRKGSLIHEMIQEAALDPLSDETDMDQLAYELRKHFLAELSFLNDLPHVIETPKRIYSHAGLIDEKTYADDFRYVLTYPLFAECEMRFTKMIVVGHMPVSEYCRFKADCNPRFFSESNIFSIDGGNMVKKAGQLNAIIFDGNLVSTDFIDHLPLARAKVTTHPKNRTSFVISFNRGEVEVVEEGETSSRVYSPYLKRTFWIDNDFLKGHKGTDFTNYEMPLRQGEAVKVIQSYGSKTQVKKQGIIGWTLTGNLEFDELKLNNPQS